MLMGIDAGYEWLLGLKLPFQCIDAQGTVSEPYCARRGRTIRFSGGAIASRTSASNSGVRRGHGHVVPARLVKRRTGNVTAA